ncbi:MAG: aminomethyl-transferring glycine dehydrogenase subunit GcvPA [Anaerolineales bacterium]|jgi:glycine dehydrogenase subunit 1
MPYIPHTDREREAMLEAIGVKTVDELFADVPAQMRFPRLHLPEPLSEIEALNELRELSEANLETLHTTCFLGAGAYNHFIPSAVQHILLRGEFYTAYTPYQPEICQGTLQAIFEYQSLIAQLTGMEVANASHYDGATATAEAVILALNQVRHRKKIVLSPGLHPQYREVVRTYMQGVDVEIGGDEAPANLQELQERSRADSLASRVDEATALVIAPYPTFLGEVEDLAPLAESVHRKGALLAVVANPIALGLLKPPGEMGADVACGEGQPLGIPLSFGGPYLGFFATRQAFVHKMSGRLVGQTQDTEGRRGYVLTLSAREQHIKRARASSNICTNQGLMALAAAVYLSQMGKQGLRRVAELCYHRAHYAAERLSQVAGFSLASRGPFFHEFVLRCPRPVAEINRFLLDEWGILGGYDLGRDFPGLQGHMLVAVTELNTREDIDSLVTALSELPEKGGLK